MKVSQIIKKIKTADAAPYYEMLENDQVLPAGMYRWRIQNDTAILERALAVDWSSVREVLSVSSSGAVTLIDALDMDNNLINNLTDPVSAQDAATKKYVDDEVAVLDYGLSFKGIVTTATSDVQFSATALAGFGDSAFKGYYVYVRWDAGGAGAAPQGEYKLISAYTSIGGVFVHAAFTADLALTDEVLIIHPAVARILDNYALLTDGTSGLSALDTDLDTLLTRLSAAKSGYLNELAPAHMPADLDTLKARLSEYRAGLLNYLTELGSAHIPADIDTLLSRLTAARATNLNYLTELSSAHIPADIDTLKTYCDILDHATYGLINLKALIDVIDGVVDAVLVDTGTTLPAQITALQGGTETLESLDDELDAELDTARGKYTKTMTGGEDDLYGESSDTEFYLQEFRVDLHNMGADDIIVFRVYTTEDGAERKISDDAANTFTGAQDPARVEIIGSANMVWGREDISVTAEQTGTGTYREIVCYWRDAKRGG